MFADRMKQLVGIVLDRDLEAVTRELLRLGAMHMIRATEVAGDHASQLGGVAQAVSAASIAETRKRVEALLDLVGVDPAGKGGLDVDRLHGLDLEESNKDLERISAGVRGVRERQRGLQQEILRLEEIARQIELFRDIGEGIRAGSRFSFLNIRAGSVPSERLQPFTDALRQWPSVQIDLEQDGERTRVLVITLRRDESAIAAALDAHGWLEGELTREDADLKKQALAELNGRLAGLRAEQDSCAVEIRDILSREQERLQDLWANLRMNELHHRIQSYFSTTVRTVLLSGWVPASMQRPLEAAVTKACDGMCVLEWHDPRPAELAAVPVHLRNPRFLAPFQMLVENYATPAYGTIDPTPFVAVTYLIMFALMFGDAGQGAVLVLASALGLGLARKAADGVRNLLRLVLYCGLAAVVTGVLFGSTFGFPFPRALWFDYHAIIAGHTPHSGFVRDVYGVLAITLYFGIAVILLGLLLNWINLVIGRQWFALFLSKGGLIGGWLYGAGVYAAFGFAKSGYRVLPPANLLFWVFGVPTLLLMAGPPIHFFTHADGHRFGPLTIVDFIMEWVVEMLEIFSGYLANTLSFMRVAGLGIAHSSLMIAFFEIARQVSSDGVYGPWSWMVLVFGNVLVILLEGLSAGIQSLRLNYYEFFSKYFSGAGKAYMPVSLGSRE